MERIALNRFSALISLAAICVALVAARVASADVSLNEPIKLDVIKATQNPLTRALVSIAFENNFSFGLGTDDEFGYGVLIKPSIPIILSDQWSIINRTTVPLFEQPALIRSNKRTFGLGDVFNATLLSPTSTRRTIWGLGPVFGFPTASEDDLGTGKWLMGPAAILVYAPRNFVFGLVAQNLWSVGGESDRRNVSELVMRPLVNINLSNGWFLSSKPVILAKWKARRSRDTWLIQAGGGVGKLFRLGNFGISLESQFFGYPAAPRGGPSWSARLDVKVLFQRGYLRERILEQAANDERRRTSGMAVWQN